MKRTASLAIIFVLLTSIFTFFPHISSVSSSETPIFQDNFETYSAGSFPNTSGWELIYNGKGNSFQVITSAVSNSPTKSLQLWGQAGWSANVQRVFSSSSTIIGYEVYLRTESNTGSGDNVASVAFWNPTAATWGKRFAGIYFQQDGRIYTRPIHVGDVNVDLGPYQANRWYKITVIVDRSTGVYDVSINDVSVVHNLAIPDTYQITAFTLGSGHAGVKTYFDDAKVFETTAPSQSSAPSIGSSLVGYWSFDEGSGTIAQDSSGKGNNGIIHTASWTTGIINNALNFNGANSYVEVQNSQDLNPAQLTLSASVNFRSLPDSNSYPVGVAHPNAMIISKGTDDTQFNGYYGLSVCRDPPSSPAVFQFYITTSTGLYWARSTTQVTENNWYNLAATYDGSTIKIYVNGKLEASTPVSGTRTLNPGNIQFGALRKPAFEYWLDGKIDEVKIYNYARSANEIMNDFKPQDSSTTPPTPTPKFTIVSPPVFSPEQPIANQPFTITVNVLNTGTISIPSPQLVYVTSASYPTTDAVGQQPTLFCTAHSSNPQTISPSEQVTLKYTGIAHWNFIAQQTLEGYLISSIDKLGKQFIERAISKILSDGFESYAISTLPYDQAILLTNQYKLAKAYYDISSNGAQAMVAAAELGKSKEYTPGATFKIGFDAGGYQVQGSLGSVSVLAPPYKLVELQQWMMAKTAASKISTLTGIAGTALLTVPVPGPHWLITGTLYGISAAVGPATDAYYRRLLVDPVDSYKQSVVVASPPSSITSLPNSTYSMLAYYTYEYVANLEASVESSARAYGALDANSTYYATIQFENAKLYAQKAAASYPLLMSCLNQTLNDVASDVNESSFNEGLSLLKEQGLPENVTKILDAMGVLGYFNLTAITTLSYQPVNASYIVESMPNLGSFLESDAQLKLANVAAMENQLPSSTQSPSPAPISGVFLPMEVIYITAAVIIAAISAGLIGFIFVKKRKLSSNIKPSVYPPPPPPP